MITTRKYYGNLNKQRIYNLKPKVVGFDDSDGKISK